MIFSRTRLFAWLVAGCGLTISAAAQDTVVVSSPSNPAARLKKQGVILDYTGGELKLKNTLGVEEPIPAARIIEIATTWPPVYEAGLKARAAGDIERAINAFRQAKRDERRPWAVRQIMADLAGCYLEVGRIDNAGDEFLALTASDPATRHIDVIPIAWRASPPDAALQSRASAWLATSSNPLAQLLGASWLLPTSKRGEATAVLEGLSRSSDPRIAGLATSQLWRTRLVNATPNEIARWKAQLEAMPPEIQAAGWFVVGDLLARHNEHEQAALAYLKIPLLFRHQRAMAADALLAAGKQLESLDRRDQAARLYREIVRDFPHLPAAAEANSRLGER